MGEAEVCCHEFEKAGHLEVETKASGPGRREKRSLFICYLDFQFWEQQKPKSLPFGLTWVSRRAEARVLPSPF